ncbi:nucleotidyltransferase family protein [Pseudoalteromonas sp. bablab_jr004]|uniref:nucleotidyltransferase family protein n=1 Tax=Pseudoalteromonas sp. bablab_jr004 TaxID=2755065 RepID=UPI0018F3676A|nr:nucleotidyltransferase family protein [Pseudoalteromonas sp. bablab_jr004]
MQPIITLHSSTTFKEAVQELDNFGTGFLACVDDSNKLIGIITDGDVRRAILNGETDIDKVVNKKPHTMLEGVSRAEIIARLKELHRRHMPIVDKSNTLKSIFFFDDIDFNTLNNSVVIMAGGLGSRLGELTKDLPKPMIHLDGKPILQHIIELFRDQGFCKFTICVNYKKEIIKDYFGSGKRLGVNIKYIEEEERLGTAGALSLIKDKFDDSFFLVNGDVITSMDFRKLLNFHVSSSSVATMCVRKYTHEVPYGVVNLEGDSILNLEEKPCLDFYINSGIYVLSQSAIELIPASTFFDMTDLFNLMNERQMHTTAYRCSNYWIDIGAKDQLDKAKCDMEL